MEPLLLCAVVVLIVLVVILLNKMGRSRGRTVIVERADPLDFHIHRNRKWRHH